MNMLETYQRILNTCNLHVDDAGMVKRQFNNKMIPWELSLEKNIVTWFSQHERILILLK